MQSPSQFSISPQTKIGEAYLTEFEVGAYFSNFYKKFTWDFGDGTFVYDVSGFKHIYDFPGIYTIRLSAWSSEGFLVSDYTQVKVEFAYVDDVFFAKTPSNYGIAGLPTPEPFVLNVISSKINEPVSLVFQAQNTKSVPYESVSPKWRHITPHWRFVDADTNKIIQNPHVVQTTPIVKNGTTVAVSGTVSFYYIDDLSTITNNNQETSCPLLLSVTLSSLNFTYPLESTKFPYHSYANSDITKANISWQINDVIPTQLKVSENYLSEIYPFKWSTVPIPVMINSMFNPKDLAGFTNSSLSGTCNVLSYPKTNYLGSLNSVKLVLSAEGGAVIPSDLYTVEVEGVSYHPLSAPLFFKREDSFKNLLCGYVFTTLTPLTSFDTNLVIAVSTVAVNQLSSTSSFGLPTGIPINSNVYISNPSCGSISKINSVLYTQDQCSNIAHYDKSESLSYTNQTVFSVPILQEENLFVSTLSGESEVYGMSYDPIRNRLYAADVDQDTILIFNDNNILLNTIQLSSYTNSIYNSPAFIAIDSVGSFWVSLYNNQRLLKFDSNLNFLVSAVPSSTVSLEASAFGSFLISPPFVEVDIQGNVWACYSHPLSSMLVKFDGNTGNELFKVNNFSVSSVPVALGIDVSNNVWVACYDSNVVQCYESLTGVLLYEVSQIYHPSYLSLDRQSRVWFTHGYDLLSVFDSTTNVLKTWKYNASSRDLASKTNTYNSVDIHAALTENEIWGGLAVDAYDKIWAIDSDNNVALVFSADDPENTCITIDVLPRPTLNPVIIGSSSSTVTLLKVRSAQASGDWTGNRWLQKFGNASNQLEIRGVSSPFKIHDINASYNITKVNEEFDMGEYLHSLALPEALNNNTELFENFLPAIVGNSNPTKESMGRIAYEKIANFIDSHADLNTASIKQLLSFAEQMSVETNGYGVDFPIEILRLLDLFSVDKFYLRGRKNINKDFLSKVGEELTLSSIISAGQYIVLRDRLYQNYNLVFVTELTGNVSCYPLSSLAVNGAREPLLVNYDFYEYVNVSDGYKFNIINWDSEFTNFDGLTGTDFFNLTSQSDWYGENGLVEIMFNNLITKRLFDKI